jgi:hypothetical protein
MQFSVTFADKDADPDKVKSAVGAAFTEVYYFLLNRGYAPAYRRLDSGALPWDPASIAARLIPIDGIRFTEEIVRRAIFALSDAGFIEFLPIDDESLPLGL